MNVLLLLASARRDGSHSRQLAARFIDQLRSQHRDLSVVTRDLGAEPPPHLDAAWTTANATPAAERDSEQRARLGFSDTLIADLRAADLIVLATPMYNFGLPSPVKAWFDHVTRAGETFSFDAATNTYTGLLTGKRAVLITASAGDYTPGTPAAAVDFLTPYVRFQLGFVGIGDLTVVAAGNLWASPDVRAHSLAEAHSALAKLASPPTLRAA
jgi:FMN-dependent NADH-azoreductase